MSNPMRALGWHALPATLSAALVLVTLLSTPRAGSAQERRPIRATDLYRIRTGSSVTMAPDGRRFAFVVTQVDSADDAYYSHIWVADSEGRSARQLTTGRARDRSPSWSPDGSRIAFVSDRDGESQIYVLSLRGGEAQRLTRFDGGASRPVWAPEGSAILFTSPLTPDELGQSTGRSTGGRPHASDAATDTAMWGSLATIRNWLRANAALQQPAVITRLDFQGERALQPIERWSQLFLIDLESGGIRRLTSIPGDLQGATLSPDGQLVAYTAGVREGVHPDFVRKSDLYVLNIDGGEPRRIEVPTHSVFAPSWSPDGAEIGFVARDTLEPGAANTEIGVIRIDGASTPSIRWLSRSMDRSVRQYRWSPDGSAIFFTAGVHGTVPIYRVELGDGVVRQLISGERGVTSFDVAGGRLAYAVTRPSNPSEVYVADAGGDDERRVTDLNGGWLSDVIVQEHRGFWYRSYDGRRIQAWVIEPVGYQSEKAYPMVLEIHGGPHAMWGPGESTMWHEFQLLAAKGYVVLYSNPRGSDGYGYEFKYVIQGAWGDGPMRDVLTAVDTVVARGLADPSRLVVTGGSYAGYLTAYLIGHDHRFKAAVAQRGVYDLSTFFGEGNAWRLIPYEFNGYPWEDYDLLRRESPITYAHQIRTPLLIMHADRDLRTGVSQSEMLYRTLKVLERPVEYVRYPREGHDLSRTGEPRLRIDRLLRIYEFFERNLRPREAGQVNRP